LAQPKARYWFKARYTIGEALDELPDDEAGIICKAIWNFAENGEEPEGIPQKLRPLWKVFRADLIQDDIDRANGAKGGNPALIHPDPVQGGLNPGSRGVEQGLPKEEKRKEENIREDKDTDIGPSAPADGQQRQRPRFTPPTVEQVREYCRGKGYTVDPEQFVDYYTSNGWKVGKNPMKDWQSAVRTWQRKEQEGGGNNGLHRTHPADRVPGQRDLYE
jgi:hypothetical protein